MSVRHPDDSAGATEMRDRDEAGVDPPARGARVPAALLFVALAGALIAQFAMDSLADESDIWHWAQHAILFWSGLAAGAALVVLYRRGQRPA